jgi:hypothetical protein
MPKERALVLFHLGQHQQLLDDIENDKHYFQFMYLSVPQVLKRVPLLD